MRAKSSFILPLILACAAWAQTPPAPQKTPTGDTGTPAKTAPKAPAGKTKAAAPHKKVAPKQPAGKTTAAKTPAKAAQKAPAKTAVTHSKTAQTKPAAVSQTKPAPVAKHPAAASKAKAAPAPAGKTAPAVPQAKTAPGKAIARKKKSAPVAKQPVGAAKAKAAPVGKQPFGAPKSKAGPVAKKAASTPTKTKARTPRRTKLKGKAIMPSSKPAPAPVQRAATAEERLRPGVRRDPFISPVIRVGNVTPCTTGGKKCLAIGDIVLKGVAKTENGMLAVVENSARKAYFLRENDPVFNGFVVKITMDEVVLRESVMDRLGHTSTRDVIKRVNPLPVG